MPNAPKIELELSGIRFLWAHFITPIYPNGRDGKPDTTKPMRYEGTVMIPKAHPVVHVLRAKLREALAAHYGADKVPDNFGPFNLPITDGDKRADDRKAAVVRGEPKAAECEYTRGYWLLNVRTGAKYELPLATVINGKAENLISSNRAAHANDFYWGVDGGCMVSFTAYDPTPLAPHGGCSCWINDAYSNMTGDKIGGSGRDPAARMSGYAGKSSDVDPTARSASGF